MQKEAGLVSLMSGLDSGQEKMLRDKQGRRQPTENELLQLAFLVCARTARESPFGYFELMLGILFQEIKKITPDVKTIEFNGNKVIVAGGKVVSKRSWQGKMMSLEEIRAIFQV